jgi:hypothetical protein
VQADGTPPVAPPPAPSGPVVAPLQVVFEHPLQPAQTLVIERVRVLMLRHVFELHDIGPTGESIHRLAVATYIPNIELRPSEDPRVLVIAFSLRSRESKQVLIWTSSLFFQYLHYHVERIALVNGRPLQMDWEAVQDPEAPARIKRWVESGQSIIERLHLNQ